MKKITTQNKIATLAILGSLILGSVPVFAQAESAPQESYIGAKMGWRANNRSQLKNEIPNDIRDARGEIRATQEEIKPILERFSYLAKVSKLSEIVQVDAEVGGCPMNETGFLEVFNNLMNEFGVLKNA